jgi:hypothetical protein
MGGDPMQDAFFPACLIDQAEPTLGQISQSAVEESARSAAGAEGEIILFAQGHPESSQGGIPGYASSDNPAADHQHIKRTCRKLLPDRPPNLCRSKITHPHPP